MRPKLIVFRSNRFISGQITDEKGRILVVLHEKLLKLAKGVKKTEKAFRTGEELGKLALKKKVNKKVSFERKKYRYHGRVKAFAEGARKAGLEF